MFRERPIAPREGFFREGELWDYKQEIPVVSRGSESDWASIAADVLAFHNTSGGVLVFGVRDRDYAFVGAKNNVQTKTFNDKIRRYVGDRFWVTYSRHFIQYTQRYLGVAIIPPKVHAPLRAMGDSPTVSGKQLLKAGDLCVRVADQTRVLRGTEAIKFAAEHSLAPGGSLYEVDEPNYRVLRPDYRGFIYRDRLCKSVENALSSDRTFTASLTGIGGVGKTALASWATLRAFEDKRFDFIVSVTAKDRAFTTTGIVPVTPNMSSLADLLRQICEVTGFSELNQEPQIETHAELVRKNILSQFKGLLFVDNLETVNDPRIIEFLEQLPLPTRAIVTSRGTRIRVAAQPIEIGPFELGEAIDLLSDSARAKAKHFITELSPADHAKIVNCCDRIPLVIEWFVGRSTSADKVVQEAEFLVSESKHGEELVEFSFRRIYGQLNEPQQMILKVLSLIGGQLPVEAIAAAAAIPIHQTADELEIIKDLSLIERQYDLDYRDMVYSLLPVTTTFVYRELTKTRDLEATIRTRLNDWYQAAEIVDPSQRRLVQQVRRGERSPELALAEVAKAFVSEGKYEDAEHYFRLALERNPINWRVHREMAEFYLKRMRRVKSAIDHYKIAVEHLPKQGSDRASVLRDYGLLLKDSGLPSARRAAAEYLEAALREDPGDATCRCALGDCLLKVGAYAKAMEVLEPLAEDSNRDIRFKVYPLLEECYSNLDERLKLGQLKQRAGTER